MSTVGKIECENIIVSLNNEEMTKILVARLREYITSILKGYCINRSISYDDAMMFKQEIAEGITGFTLKRMTIFDSDRNESKMTMDQLVKIYSYFAKNPKFDNRTTVCYFNN